MATLDAMKPAVAALSAALLFTGCATHTEEQIAAVRAAGVAPRTVAKLERDRVLAPEDLVELRRRGVSDSVALRHLDEVGVDYLPNRTDVRRLRSAGVRPAVIHEFVREGEEFARDHEARESYWAVGLATYDPWYFSQGRPYWRY